MPLVRILPNGDIQFIDKDELTPLKEIGSHSKTRASHVEPSRWMLRVLFHLLRYAFGESGAVSHFTRRWSCQWRVNLSRSKGPIENGFTDRAKAIQWEIQWLEENHLGKTGL